MLLLFTLSGVDGSGVSPGGVTILPPGCAVLERLGLLAGEVGGEEKEREGSGLGGRPSEMPRRFSSREVSSLLVVVESRMLSNSEGERRDSLRCWFDEEDEVGSDGGASLGVPVGPMLVAGRVLGLC